MAKPSQLEPPGEALDPVEVAAAMAVAAAVVDVVVGDAFAGMVVDVAEVFGKGFQP